MIRQGYFYLVTRIQIIYIVLTAHRLSHNLSEFVRRIGHIRSDIKDLVSSSRNIYACGDDWSHVSYVRICTLLRSVPKDRHRLPAQQLIHEDSDYIAIAVSNVLPLTVDVVWTKDYIIQAEHLMAYSQFLLHP